MSTTNGGPFLRPSQGAPLSHPPGELRGGNGAQACPARYKFNPPYLYRGSVKEGGWRSGGWVIYCFLKGGRSRGRRDIRGSPYLIYFQVPLVGDLGDSKWVKEKILEDLIVGRNIERYNEGRLVFRFPWCLRGTSPPNLGQFSRQSKPSFLKTAMKTTPLTVRRLSWTPHSISGRRYIMIIKQKDSPG
jgi:hypothetical protein